MLEAVIVDDEIKALQSLSWELTNLSDEVDIIASFTDAREALDYLEKTLQIVCFWILKCLQWTDFSL